MSASTKLKEFIKRNHITRPYLSKLIDININTLHNKFARDNFEANDLIKIAEVMGYKLAFVKDGEMFILE